MKKYVQLNLKTAEKRLLRQQKISMAQLPDYAPDEIAAILKASPERAREIHALIEFQSIPSLGAGFARELIDQGYYSLEQLKGKDAVSLFEAYERHCNAWADPCVEDSYRLLAHFIEHRDYSKRWWHFTAERKVYRTQHGFSPDPPKRAWHELEKYQKVNMPAAKVNRS
jgi:hypothetical protein